MGAQTIIIREIATPIVVLVRITIGIHRIRMRVPKIETMSVRIVNGTVIKSCVEGHVYCIYKRMFKSRSHVTD